MSKTLFIIALILIGETLFRLFPAYTPEQYKDVPTYSFFPLNGIRLHADYYTYCIFEHLKVFGLAWIAGIVFSRLVWLKWIFLIDLVIFLLNYNSTLFYVGWFPVGADTIKLFIFGGVVIREALTYFYGTPHPGNNLFRRPSPDADSNLLASLRTDPPKGGVRIIKASVPRNTDRSKA